MYCSLIRFLRFAKYGWKSFFTVSKSKDIFWAQVNLQLLFIADLKHKCVDDEHRKTKPGRQVLRQHRWRCNQEDNPWGGDLPDFVQPGTLDHLQLWDTEGCRHPRPGQFNVFNVESLMLGPSGGVLWVLSLDRDPEDNSSSLCVLPISLHGDPFLSSLIMDNNGNFCLNTSCHILHFKWTQSSNMISGGPSWTVEELLHDQG